jgi:hypothetical protein
MLNLLANDEISLSQLRGLSASTVSPSDDAPAPLRHEPLG